MTITGRAPDNKFGTLDDYAATVLTAGGGLCLLDELMPDVYWVDFTALGAMVFTPRMSVPNEAVDSDPVDSGRVGRHFDNREFAARR